MTKKVNFQLTEMAETSLVEQYPTILTHEILNFIQTEIKDLTKFTCDELQKQDPLKEIVNRCALNVNEKVKTLMTKLNLEPDHEIIKAFEATYQLQISVMITDRHPELLPQNDEAVVLTNFKDTMQQIVEQMKSEIIIPYANSHPTLSLSDIAELKTKCGDFIMDKIPLISQSFGISPDKFESSSDLNKEMAKNLMCNAVNDIIDSMMTVSQ